MIDYAASFFGSSDGFLSGSIISIVIPVIIILFFIKKYESTRPEPRMLAAVAVIGGISAFLRVPFAAFPGVQPSTMIVLIAGMSMGKQHGAFTGMITAFVSNMMLGQGIWTLWQMAAWGTIGYFGGFLGTEKLLVLIEDKTSAAILGIFTGMVFGLIVNTMTWLAFYPLNFKSFILVYLLGIWFDIIHGLGNAGFNVILGKRLFQIIRRHTIRFEVEYLD